MVRKQRQKGQALVTTMMLVVVFGIFLGVLSSVLVTDRDDYKTKKKRLDAFYAAESAEQTARVAIEDYIVENFQLAYDDWKNERGAAGEIVQTDAPTYSPVTDYYNYTSTFFDNMKPLTNSLDGQGQTSGGEKKLINPMSFEVLFFDDRNNNKTQDSSEEGFVLTNTEIAAFAQTYTYRYTLTSHGVVRDNERAIVSIGELKFGAAAESFAKYALFTNTHLTDGGSNIWFTERTNFDGPVHTNGSGNTRFRFFGNPSLGGKSATFGGPVTSANDDIHFYHDGIHTPPLSNMNPSAPGEDVPVFAKGYDRGVDHIDLPTNSFSQERSAMGGSSLDTSILTNSERRTLLGLTVNSNPVPDGIYVTQPGGVYVQGDADSLILSVDGQERQVYTIEQGGVTKQITLDKAANQVLVSSTETTTTTTQCGTERRCRRRRRRRICEDVPQYCTTTQTTTVDETLNGKIRDIVHVQGNIDFMGGPPRTPSNSDDPFDAPPAIQKDQGMTVSASGDIVLQRDLNYQDDPRGPDGEIGTPDDNNDAKNALGIFTSGGKVRIGMAAPDNIALHASIMASGSGKVFTVDNYSSRTPSGTINILGGVITERYGAVGTFSGSTGQYVSGYGRNFVYDRRFQTGTSPPYFPTLGDLVTALPLMNQLTWKETRI